MEWPGSQLGVWLEVGGIEGILFYDREEAIDWLIKK